MAKPNADDRDVLVRREEICKYFSPPPSKSSFFEWVDAGKIKKARDLPGYYKLNATLLHQGLPAVDISKYQKAREDLNPAVRLQQLLYIAVASTSHLYHNLLDESPFLCTLPASLTESDFEQIQKFQKAHAEAGKDFNSNAFRQMAYQSGWMDALFALFEAQQTFVR